MGIGVPSGLELLAQHKSSYKLDVVCRSVFFAVKENVAVL